MHQLARFLLTSSPLCKLIYLELSLHCFHQAEMHYIYHPSDSCMRYMSFINGLVKTLKPQTDEVNIDHLVVVCCNNLGARHLYECTLKWNSYLKVVVVQAHCFMSLQNTCFLHQQYVPSHYKTGTRQRVQGSDRTPQILQIMGIQRQLEQV